ncbi:MULTISPECIES: phosphatase PAP2 family protein [Erwinia]|uniref:phosphatase PAP2 family protein n=1 Tax=Erwinia TaxID=551 RepID=UPI00054CF7EF|nr:MULTISPECIES: phosphatase PAP2 family protein [Erwinia]
MIWHIVHILTYFGDSMLLIPTAVIVAIAIKLKSSDPRAVWYWIAAFCTAGAVVSLSKIAFMGFGIGNARFNFTGFSGHSAMSATLWPVLLWLLSGGLSSFWRGVACAVGYFIPLIVGASRLLLHYHSTSEVVTGLTLGFILSTVFLFSQRGRLPQPFAFWQVCLTLLLPVLLLGHGRIATTQQFLQRLSVQLAGIDHAWTREELLKLRHEVAVIQKQLF